MKTRYKQVGEEGGGGGSGSGGNDQVDADAGADDASRGVIY